MTVRRPPVIDGRVVRFLRRVAAASVPATATSWWRSRSRNAAVGGLPASRHLWGGALDVVPRIDRMRAAERYRGAGLTVIDEGDHLHLQ